MHVWKPVLSIMEKCPSFQDDDPTSFPGRQLSFVNCIAAGLMSATLNHLFLRTLG